MVNFTISRMRQFIFFLFLLLVILERSAQGQRHFIAFSDPNLRYQGRILKKQDAAVLSWPGTSVTINFEGTNIAAVLKDADTADYFNIIIDGKDIVKIHTDLEKRSYLLASHLSNGKHHVQLFKRTEWDKGKTWFYGFESTSGVKLLPAPAAQRRKIEFYGNSITCGYGIEDSSGNDSGQGYFENNYLSYAAITARHFDAQYACISKSGIGVIVSWFPLIMAEMYDRLDPTDPASKWDFSNYTPDIVVINLFQNDDWILKLPDNDQFKARFGTKAPNDSFIISSYTRFIMDLRKKYPNAYLICALGCMDATKKGSPWPGYIRKSALALHDPKIFTHFFDYKNADGHPNIAEQRVMANSLIDFIEHHIQW